MQISIICALLKPSTTLNLQSDPIQVPPTGSNPGAKSAQISKAKIQVLPTGSNPDAKSAQICKGLNANMDRFCKLSLTSCNQFQLRTCNECPLFGVQLTREFFSFNFRGGCNSQFKPTKLYLPPSLLQGLAPLTSSPRMFSRLGTPDILAPDVY